MAGGGPSLAAGSASSAAGGAASVVGSSRRVMVESGGLSCRTVITDVLGSSSRGLASFRTEAISTGLLGISVPAEESVFLLSSEEEVSEEGRRR